MYQQPQRMEFLDSIRGLAAIAVLLSHSFVFMWPPIVWKLIDIPFLNIPFNGKEAVAMFFVLSGFLLSRPYFTSTKQNEPPRSIYLPTFYLRRFSRIWLPWFSAFCLSALAQLLIFHNWTTFPPQSDWFRMFWHVPLTFENALRQCVFIMHDMRVQLLNQDWSLGVELKASILLPLLIWLCRACSAWSLVFISVPLVIFERMGPAYCSFILGVLLARKCDSLVQSHQLRSELQKIGVLILGLTLYEAFHLGFLLGYPNASPYLWVVTSLGCVLILLSSMASQRIQTTLHHPFLIFLGRISYSVYLLQFIVILCVLPFWVHLLNSWGVYRTIWLLPLNFMASLSLTIGLSAINYRCVELPCINLGHWLSKKIQTKFVKTSNS